MCFEIKGTSKETSHTLLTPVSVTGIGAVMRCQDFSSPLRLFRVTTYVLKFARELVRALNKDGGGSQLHTADSDEAERLWIIESQSAFTQDKNFDTWNKNSSTCSLTQMTSGDVEDDLPKQLSYAAKYHVLLTDYTR